MSFASDYDSLIRSFVDDPKFIAREWLGSEILDALCDPGKSFVLLTAQSGAGKTVLSAWLARTHPDWLRYFIRRDSRTPLSSGDAASFLFAIGHELALRRPHLFHPDRLEIVVKQRIGELQPGARAVGLTIDDLHVSPFYRTAVHVEQHVEIAGGNLDAVVVKRMVTEERFLEIDDLQYLALLDPAAVLEQEDPSARIVIVVDALDEIQLSHEQRSLLDWLATCPELPANVKFVLTSRPDADLRRFRGAKSNAIREMTIDPARREVQTDVEAYLKSFASQPQAARALDRNSIEPETFIRSARQKARGNFAYVSTLTRGILEAEARGNAELVLQLLRLQQVPEQLTDLYEYFLSLLRDRVVRLGELEISRPVSEAEARVPAWEGVAQRILGILSVARESLTPEEIARLGGIRVWPREVGNVLGLMLEFLGAEEGRYGLFHTSFAEYLASPATRRSAPDYYFDPVEWHSRIVRAYKGRASDWAAVDWAAMDNYGLTHLADHVLGSGDEMRGELSDLVQPAARTALLNRFLTDAVFLRTVTLATREVLSAADVAAAMPRLIYLSAVKALLSTIGDRMTPPVLGLMTRMGRIATALGYVETMNATTDRYHGLKAIIANASAADLERAADMTSLERLEAFAFEPAKSSYRYAFHSDRDETILDLARFVAPSDLDRALKLVAPLNPDGDPAAQDLVLRSAALSKDDPGDAVELIRAMKEDVAGAALDCAERLLPAAGEGCRPLLTLAEAHVDFGALSRKTAVYAGRLVRAWTGIDLAHGRELWAVVGPTLQAAASGAKPLPDEHGGNALWSLAKIACDVWDFDNGSARALLDSAFDGEADASNVDSFLEAAKVFAEKGVTERARSLVDRALAVSRTHAPHATARDLTKASEAMRPGDPDYAQSLMDEAFTLFDNEEQPVAMRNDLSYSQMAQSLAPWDMDSALRAARRIEGLAWSKFPDDMDGDDRTSVLVRLAVQQLPSNPALAAALLDECINVLTQVEGIQGAQGPSYSSGIDLDASELKGKPLHNAAMQLVYYANALNHGMERRAWRVFDTPIALLYDLLAPPRLNGSPYYVGRTIRRFAEAAAVDAPDVASQLCELNTAETEQAIGYAAIFDALAMKDWDEASKFANGALSIAASIDADAGKSLQKEFEVLRWTNRKVRSLMEIAMHLGRYHPPSMQQLVGRIDSQSMMFHVSCEMISRTIEAESAARLKSGGRLEGEIDFASQALAFLTMPTDTTPAWIMAGHVLRTLACLDIEQARLYVSKFPVDALGALLRIRVASGVTSLNPEQALAWLREAVESLEADASDSHRASVLGRAAAVAADADRKLAGEWGARAVELARGIPGPLEKGYAFLDLLRQPALHSIVRLQTLVEEITACLDKSDSPDTQSELAMHAFPVLLELAPRQALGLFSNVASRHWITLLALLDHGAEALAKVCRPASLPALATALNEAMQYLQTVAPQIPKQAA